MKLCDCLAVSRRRRFKSFFQRHSVCAWSVLLSPDSTQTACSNANVRGINVPIDVEIRLIAMHALANVVRKPPYGQNVSRLVKRQSVTGAQPFRGEYLVFNWIKPFIFSLKNPSLKRMRGGHWLNDNAGGRWKS